MRETLYINCAIIMINIACPPVLIIIITVNIIAPVLRWYIIHSPAKFWHYLLMAKSNPSAIFLHTLVREKNGFWGVEWRKHRSVFKFSLNIKYALLFQCICNVPLGISIIRPQTCNTVRFYCAAFLSQELQLISRVYLINFCKFLYIKKT